MALKIINLLACACFVAVQALSPAKAWAMDYQFENENALVVAPVIAFLSSLRDILNFAQTKRAVYYEVDQLKLSRASWEKWSIEHPYGRLVFPQVEIAFQTQGLYSVLVKSSNILFNFGSNSPVVQREAMPEGKILAISHFPGYFYCCIAGNDAVFEICRLGGNASKIEKHNMRAHSRIHQTLVKIPSSSLRVMQARVATGDLEGVLLAMVNDNNVLVFFTRIIRPGQFPQVHYSATYYRSIRCDLKEITGINVIVDNMNSSIPIQLLDFAGEIKQTEYIEFN